MSRSRKNLVITLTFTFILMALLVVFTSRVIFRTAFSSVQELGDDKAVAITADLENYLDTAKSVLWLAADTVDHMVESGATDEEIVEYITRESERTEEQFDESYTGLYGVINGNYVDGVGWVPPVDYDPTTRDWYKTTTGAKGDVIIVSPYVDAQTGNVIISVGRALSDNNNALALDLTLNNVQDIVEDININGYGYGFVVNNDGMVIAHKDKTQNGKNYNDDPEHRALFQEVVANGKGNFSTEIDGDRCTVFVDTVMDQWYLVIVTKDSDLYRDPMFLLIVSIIISLIVFILISVFYFLGYRSERKFFTRMEAMKEIERKRDYEARILKLEKSAADSANKAKSDFLADMSHEIRTPINAILGMNEMILHESREDYTLDYASNIKSAGTTLLSIINTILDFSKIEDGRMRLVPVEFDTVEMINGLVNSISERAKEKNLDLRVEIDESVPSKLMGDDVRISQVIMNLLTNAVKYTERGYILFKIQKVGEADGRTNLLVSVKDTGIGIKKEDIDKLSISFERVDEKKNRHIEGTGLGISIVTKLLDMMNSELKIKSEYGVGSEFYFELPVEVVDATPIGTYDASSRGRAKTAESSIGMSAPKARVLLTDDNKMNRKVASNLLKLFGIKPDICGSGVDTITEMKKNEYEILFLDHMMPEMDGIETLKYLKEMDLVGNTRIIALTANAVVGAKEQYMEAGFDDYLSKPIDIPELEKMLRKYLPEDIIEAPIDGRADEAPDDGHVGEAKDDEHAGDDNGSKAPGDDNGSEGAEIGTTDISDLKGIARLEKLGLSIEAGLKFCGGDEDFYLEVIGDYVKESPEKIEKLTELLQAGNLKDYRVMIHSVKSASKTIGAMEMFEDARALEFAAGDEKMDYVQEHHDEVMEEYKKLCKLLEDT